MDNKHRRNKNQENRSNGFLDFFVNAPKIKKRHENYAIGRNQEKRSIVVNS